MSDSKNFAKLVTHVGTFMKTIVDIYLNGEVYYGEPIIEVKYNFECLEGHVYVAPEPYRSGVMYNYKIIDTMAQLSEKHTISYKVGTDKNGILHFQIYV